MTDRAADPGNRPAAPSPLVDPAATGFAVRLVRRATAEANADGSPFVVLHEGRRSRVLLAEATSPAGRALARFAWKLRLDVPPTIADAAPGNAEVDASWARERRDHERLRSPHVVAPFVVPTGMLRSPPIWWCRRIDRFFHPVSPTSGAVLTTCRDAAWLAANGLPPYAADSVRYLTDRSGVAPTFFTPQPARDVELLPTGAQVRSQRQLVRDYAALVHAPAGDAIAAAAQAHLPCLGCDHRQACYAREAAAGALPAERELVPVSFHDVEAEAFELLQFDFAEACALVGGASLGDVLLTRGPDRAEPLAGPALQGLEEGVQWLFASDASRWPLEVLRHKLRLFLDVCAGVEAVHAAGRPHLGLCPAHVLANFAPTPGAPARWQLHAKIADLGSASLVPMPKAGGAAQLAVDAMLELGADVRDDARAQAYVAPMLLARDGQSVTLPVACWQTGDTDGLVRLAVETQGAGVPRTFRAGDTVVVQPASGGPSLVARIDEMRSRGLVAAALLPPNDPCTAWNGTQFEARVSFHRRLGPAADLYGLGMLLLHALLVDDAQGIETVADAVGKCLRRLEDEPSGVRLESRTAASRLLQMLTSSELRGCCEASHVLHRAADRAAIAQSLPPGEPVVPAAIWQPLLLIAARALAGFAPFALAPTHADGGDAARQELVRAVETAIARLDVELFFPARRDAAVAAACHEVAEHLRRAGTPTDRSEPGPETPGFRLLLRRDGDGKEQELRYEIERVTIGRREGENLLRLNDPMVSSLHAVIEYTPEGWVIVDRNSTNGTEVDGIRLPVDVPQPLVEGSVVTIRPFRLTFRELASTQHTLVAPQLSPATLRERLHAAFAAAHAGGTTRAHEALLAVLREASTDVEAAELLRLLEGLLQAAPKAAVPESPMRPLEGAAARALQQLSRSLVGTADFTTPEQIQLFVGKLGRFVDATTQWIERVLDLRKALGKHLDFGAASTASGRPSARTAAEVRAIVAGWQSDAPPVEAAGWYVTRFYDDVIAIIGGLLAGNQQVRKAVRDRLDPARLVELASREAALRLLVQTAANSSLWKLYIDTFREITGGGDQDQELAQLLQRVAALRT